MCTPYHYRFLAYTQLFLGNACSQMATDYMCISDKASSNTNDMSLIEFCIVFYCVDAMIPPNINTFSAKAYCDVMPDSRKRNLHSAKYVFSILFQNEN